MIAKEQEEQRKSEREESASQGLPLKSDMGTQTEQEIDCADVGEAHAATVEATEVEPESITLEVENDDDSDDDSRSIGFDTTLDAEWKDDSDDDSRSIGFDITLDADWLRLGRRCDTA